MHQSVCTCWYVTWLHQFNPPLTIRINKVYLNPLTRKLTETWRTKLQIKTNRNFHTEFQFNSICYSSPRGKLKSKVKQVKKGDTNTVKTKTVESLHTFLLSSCHSSSSCTLRCVKWCNVPKTGCNVGDLGKAVITTTKPRVWAASIVKRETASTKCLMCRVYTTHGLCEEMHF